ncbi:hypothetical protein EUTSA_v10005808mg [Eutrema salsugineum]|uniref:Uncharacterized protein n=1 Tax=Eutrema salsugineum TaxID=72664 RepID=V4LNZ3_EUTSA|nr:hypothetical protein EUTSA_v10005808mg [Eutrema salsugineum]
MSYRNRREYARGTRSVELRKCWPFSGEFTGDLIRSLLPPITVSKFRWWSHELASLLANSPVTPDDSEPDFRRNAKAKSRPCKKRCIVEIFAETPQIQLERREDEGEHPDVLIGSKRKQTNDLLAQKKIQSKKSKESFDDKKTTNKVNRCKERSGVMSLSGKKKAGGGTRRLSYTEEELFPNSPKSVRQEWDSEFQIPGILKAKRKVCSVSSPDEFNIDASQCERHVRFSDQSEMISQLENNLFSVERCCSQMNRLSLFSAEDQSPGNDMKWKVTSNELTSDSIQLGSRQQNKFQPVVSERRLSHALTNSGLSCFPRPHLSLERIKDALDLQNEGPVAQPIQSFLSTSSESPYRSCSSSLQPASADMQCGTLLNESPFDPFLVEWMQKSALYRQKHLEEAISGCPLNLQGELVEANGEGCRSFDRSGLSTASSRSASAGNDILLGNLVDFSSGKTYSTEPALAKDVERYPVHKEKRNKYFPARLGVDENFIEKPFFSSDTNVGECGQTVLSPVSEDYPMSHTINLPKLDALNQNLISRNMVANRDGLCMHNTQATMRLIGKDVSVGKSYSDMVRTGERIMAPDASIDYSFLGSYTHHSWLWRTTILGVSENHSNTTIDRNWNRDLLCDTSKDPFPRFFEPHVGLASQARTAVAPDSEFPPTMLSPCGSLKCFPLTEKDLSFHDYGLGQQQLPFPSDYSNIVGIGLLPDARNPSFGLPFSCTDSTRQSKPH